MGDSVDLKVEPRRRLTSSPARGKAVGDGDGKRMIGQGSDSAHHSYAPWESLGPYTPNLAC